MKRSLLVLASLACSAMAANRTASADEPAIAEIPAPTRKVAPAALVRAAPRPVMAGIRRQVDPNDNVDRALLLAPGGPFVIQTTVFVDGQPFRAHREKMVDELLKQADTNGDGQPLWDEAIRNPRFGYGRYYQYALQRPEQRTALIRQFDHTDDGVIDRYEARMFIAQLGGGAEFQVQSAGAAQPDIRSLLDANRDGILSSEEIAAASERLRSRDQNDNDLVESQELGGAAAYGAIRNVATIGAGGPASGVVVLSLEPGFAPSVVRSALLARYGREGKLVAASFPALPRLLDGLDRNANGELDENEIPLLAAIRPHVAATIHLGKVEGRTTPSVGITWLAEEFLGRNEGEGFGDARRTMSLPGLRLAMKGAPESPSYDYKGTATTTLNRYDTDKNGYLEKKELEGDVNKQFLLQQFDRWDDNGDGKVYPEEIVADYDRQMAPQRSQVSLTAADRGAALFTTLDQSGDGRLSLRETRTAAARLLTLDSNGNGQLDPEEVPTEIEVVLGRGGSFGAVRGGGLVVLSSAGSGGAASPQSTPRAARWFVHMDRNGDGDITPREFLGTPEKFRQLDKNNDGFIEPSEAPASEK